MEIVTQYRENHTHLEDQWRLSPLLKKLNMPDGGYLMEVIAAAMQETELQWQEVMGNRDVKGNGLWEDQEIKIKDHSAHHPKLETPRLSPYITVHKLVTVCLFLHPPF